MIPLILVGTFWFWAILLALVIMEGCFVARDHTGAAVVTIVATLVGLQILTNVPVFQYIYVHPYYIIIIFGMYLVVGTVWSFVKWWFYLHDKHDEMVENYSYKFGELKSPDQTTREHAISYLQSIIPTASDNKSKIINWMTFWPWSMLWSLFSDFIYKIFKRIYQSLQTAYESMSNRIFKDIHELK